jgi:hypothetical protein
MFNHTGMGKRPMPMNRVLRRAWHCWLEEVFKRKDGFKEMRSVSGRFWATALMGSAAASVDFVMGAQSQQEDGLLAIVLHVLEDDPQIVARAASPTTRKRPAQFVCSQRRMCCISR